MSDTLLLADESVTMQRVVELTFAEQGLKIASVSDGQQAIDYITAYRPALALINVTLPKVNGFEVARFVRDHAENRLPVLLLAGAFDNLDDRKVRESGAAGVLVKPFEPAVVIKRVKELLGMKADTARPEGARPLSDSWRLVTLAEAPVRSHSSASRTPAATNAPEGPWQRLREESGLGRDAASVEVPSRDYLDQLDAAFESLDAQLAGRPAPGERAHATPSPTIPAALDLVRQPAMPTAEPEHVWSAPAPFENASKPVFEVDEDWFAKKPQNAEPISSLTEFVVTRASDFPTPHLSTVAPEDQSWIPSVAAASRTVDTPATEQDPDVASASATPPEEVATFATPPGAPGTPTAPPFAAADAFAMLWAQEQGEAVPAPLTPAPPDLNESSLDMLAARITERVSTLLSGPVVEKMRQDLAAPLTNDVVSRLAPGLSEDLLNGLSERLARGLAERVAELVAERVLQSALGDELRQTVNTVAERVVRAEIERISTAARSRRTS